MAGSPWAQFAKGDAKRVRSMIDEVGRFLAYAARRFSEDRCLRMAASLSYTSLLAIVPLTAIAFSMLAAFPVFENIRGEFQEAIFSNFLPQSAAAMREYFDQFLRNTTRLTAVGVVGLTATAVLLLGTIEADLNTIFRVGRPRAMLPRLLVFWALITLGPLLLGASFSLSTYFFALTEWVGGEAVNRSVGWLTGFLPTLIVMVALTLCYVVVPNRRIRLRDALLGGIVAGVLFAGLRRGFGFYVTNFPTYQTIYGAVSVVPIFLVWMYLSWAVVLLGAILTAALGEWRAGMRHARSLLRPAERLDAALAVLALLLRESRIGQGLSRERLLKESGLDGVAIDRLLTDFQNAGYVDRTQRHGWALIRDLTAVSLYDFMAALGLTVEPGEADPATTPWRRRLRALLDEMADRQRQGAGLTLRELLDADEPMAADKPLSSAALRGHG